MLDPNTSMIDPISGATVMNEVFTVLGPTQEPDLPGVDEWCINSAAIDSANKCAVINSEDGHVYRWDFTTNTLTPGLVPGARDRRSVYLDPDRPRRCGLCDQQRRAVLLWDDARQQLAPTLHRSVAVGPRTGAAGFRCRSSSWRDAAVVSGRRSRIGILAALSVHWGIKVSSRRRRASGSFLSG